MSRQPAWNKYEVALLIVAYIRITDKPETKSDILRGLSADLRRMAINKGEKIDDVYRNLNGMLWQFNFIEKMFRKTVVKNHSPSKMFQDMVLLYKNDINSFDEVVAEARNMVSLNSRVGFAKKATAVNVVEESLKEYSAWLLSEKKLAPRSCEAYASNLRSLCAYCYDNVIVEGNFLNANKDTLYSMASQILNNENFRIYNARQHNRFSAALKKYVEFKLGSDHILSEISERQKQREISSFLKQKKTECTHVEYLYQREVSTVLKSHFPYGYRIESSIEMKRFRKFAETASVVLPEIEDQLKAEILNAGFLFEGKIYFISNELIAELTAIITKLATIGTLVFFFDAFAEKHGELIEKNHIISLNMLRKIFKWNQDKIFADPSNTYITSNFVSIAGKFSENELITKEMYRVWGTSLVCSISELSEHLPYIPKDYIKRYISGSRNFTWVSEETYLLTDKFVVNPADETMILDFVSENCEVYGFASISDIPFGSIAEEHYEISSTSLLRAIYNKVLYDDFYLNGKILTKEKSDLDVVTLVKKYVDSKDECTFAEANDKVIELAGGKYRYMAYEALYNSMIRVNVNQYVADCYVTFDVAAIDEILSDIIKDGFIAIKELTTFALFPMCGQAWNHFLLESFCFRFSRKYSLRNIGFNDKNIGIIAKRETASSYENLLAIAAAKAKIELMPKTLGEYLFDTGYMGKRKFAGLDSVVQRAIAIREEK